MLRTLAAAIIAAAVSPAFAKQQPNLVFCLVDDLGWNGVGFHNPDVKTPVIDALAKEGLYLDSFYTYKVCSPARGSFLSGRFPYHLASIRTNFAYFDVLEGLNLTYTLLPEKLHDLGYATHMVGKWHQGFYAPQYLPTSRGFDSYFGFLAGCEDHDNQEVCGNSCNKDTYGVGAVVDLYTSSGPALGQNGTNNGFIFTTAAVNVVSTHAAENKALAAQGHDGKPLFLYLALHNTHAPFEVPAAYSNKYNFTQALRNTWSGMVSMVDETVDNVTSAMKKEGLWDNTLWIMSGDNGSPTGGWGAAGSNAPLRGSKASNWEGGVKVFAFATGGVIPASMAGTHLDGLFHICDLYKTFLALAGAPNATDAGGPAPLDSLDLSKYLLGHDAESTRNIIVHDHFGGAKWNPPNASGRATGAIRVGDWKLLVGPQSYATWFGEFSPNMTGPSNASSTQACQTGPCLFNIKNDTTEHHDLSAEMPEKVAEILLIFSGYDNAFKAGPNMGGDHNGYCTAVAGHHGFMSPWMAKPATKPVPQPPPSPPSPPPSGPREEDNKSIHCTAPDKGQCLQSVHHAVATTGACSALCTASALCASWSWSKTLLSCFLMTNDTSAPIPDTAAACGWKAWNPKWNPHDANDNMYDDPYDVDPLLDLEIESAEFASFVSGGAIKGPGGEGAVGQLKKK